MRDPVAGPFFGGRILSTLGALMFTIAAAITAFDITGSAVTVAAVTLANYLPQILFAPVTGRFSDLGGARMQIVLGRLVVGAGSCSLAAAIHWSGGVTEMTSATPVVICAAVVGMGFVLGGPSTQAMLSRLVRPGELAKATALNSVVPMSVGRAAAPVLGSLITLQFGATAAFITAGALNIAYGVLVGLLALPKDPTAHHSRRTIRAALAFVRTSRPIQLLILGIGAVGFVQEPSISSAPVLAAEFGGGAGISGWISSTYGVGVAAGLAVLVAAQQRMSLQRLACGGLLLAASGISLSGFAFSLWISLAAMLFSGIGMSLAFTSITTMLQQKTPMNFRGRVMAFWFVGFLGARPLAAALNGVLTDLFGVGLALAATSALVCVVAWTCRPSALD
jgi:MFS family permease